MPEIIGGKVTYSPEEMLESFTYNYIETGFVDYDRTKTIAAMRHFAERVPQAVIDELPRILVFAPSQHIWGECYPWCETIGGNGEMRTVEGSLVYLAPELEEREQDDVDFTVAHEFAHAILRHALPGGQRGNGLEQEADALVAEWGLKVPAGRSEIHAQEREWKGGK